MPQDDFNTRIVLFGRDHARLACSPTSLASVPGIMSLISPVHSRRSRPPSGTSRDSAYWQRRARSAASPCPCNGGGRAFKLKDNGNPRSHSKALTKRDVWHSRQLSDALGMSALPPTPADAALPRTIAMYQVRTSVPECTRRRPIILRGPRLRRRGWRAWNSAVRGHHPEVRAN